MHSALVALICAMVVPAASAAPQESRGDPFGDASLPYLDFDEFHYSYHDSILSITANMVRGYSGTEKGRIDIHVPLKNGQQEETLCFTVSLAAQGIQGTPCDASASNLQYEFFSQPDCSYGMDNSAGTCAWNYIFDVHHGRNVAIDSNIEIDYSKRDYGQSYEVTPTQCNSDALHALQEEPICPGSAGGPPRSDTTATQTGSSKQTIAASADGGPALRPWMLAAILAVVFAVNGAMVLFGGRRR